MENQTIPCKALVLAGGGARGSYQVGVWKADHSLSRCLRM